MPSVRTEVSRWRPFRLYRSSSTAPKTAAPFFVAIYEGRVVAGHTAIVAGDIAFTVTTASSDDAPDLPRGYALLAETMKTVQSQGVRIYDMAGIAPAPKDGAPDPGADGRNRFKSSFRPSYHQLVPPCVIPLRRPAHDVFFNARQLYRYWKAR